MADVILVRMLDSFVVQKHLVSKKSKMHMDEFEQRIRGRDLGSISELIVHANHGTAERRSVAKLVRENLSISETLDWCRYWSLKEDSVSRKLACAVVAVCYPMYREDVLELLVCLANDPNWGVREEITWAFAEVLENYFEDVYLVFEKWTRHPSENIRRAVVVATKRVGKSRRLEFAHPLFELLEPLLWDRSFYVRKNLGPFALGDGLVKYYPEIAFNYLHKWVKNTDEQVRWNVAMSMSSTAGFAYPDEALAILEELAVDKRKYVWRAVASALKRLARKHPSIVCTAMQTWCEDPSKQHVGRLVWSSACQQM